jgi:UDP-glucose 4-epimerase
MDFRGRRVLVTGASGFIGANLTRTLLDSGAHIHALVRQTTDLWRMEQILSQVKLHRVDLLDRVLLREIVCKIEPEIIFHLAVSRAESSAEQRWATLQTNVSGTFNLLEITSALSDCHFVCVSSSMEYGARKRPLQESDYPQPTTLFGATKAASTLLCQQFARASGRSIVVLRPFLVYGYWESPERFIPKAMMSAIQNREIALTQPGYRRDWLFVEDVVEACLLAAQAANLTGEIINVGSGEQWSNEEIVAMVESVSGQTLRTRRGEHPARAWDTTCWVADTHKARQLLAWEPKHSLRAGLEKTLAWLWLNQHIYR